MSLEANLIPVATSPLVSVVAAAAMRADNEFGFLDLSICSSCFTWSSQKDIEAIKMTKSDQKETVMTVTCCLNIV